MTVTGTIRTDQTSITAFAIGTDQFGMDFPGPYSWTIAQDPVNPVTSFVVSQDTKSCVFRPILVGIATVTISCGTLSVAGTLSVTQANPAIATLDIRFNPAV